MAAKWQPPMLAQLLRLPEERSTLEDAEWIYERKLDGLRCLATRSDTEVQLWSRNHLSFSARFPRVVSAVSRLQVGDAVLDGEIVAFDEAGRSSFTLLQQPGSDARPVYVVFDVLRLLGEDTSRLALEERLQLLDRLLSSSPSQDVLGVERVSGDPADLLARACRDGWEGLIAKRSGSDYRPGRSPDWRKLKCSASQELVIGGWTDPAGTRTGFGALLVGYYDDGGLVYAGKVGTGFSEESLRSLHAELRARALASSPFVSDVRERGAHWVRPDMVAAVAFTEWTREGKLRHPRFEGLRPDKAASEVRREVRPG